LFLALRERGRAIHYIFFIPVSGRTQIAGSLNTDLLAIFEYLNLKA
jgi:hypothetical protein